MSRFFVVLFLTALATPASAQLQHYETILRLQEPVPNVAGVNTVVFQWSTTQDFGTVGETDLFNWQMKLLVGDTQIYTDHIVAGGTVLPFDGLERVIPGADYYWRFNLDIGELEEMVSVSSDLAANSTGEHYVVNDSVSIQDDGIVDVSQFLDGVIQDGQSNFLDVQTTEVMIFFDGFETGDTSLWSTSQGNTFQP